MTPAQQEALDALEKYGGVNAAARALGIARSSLQERIRRARTDIDPAIQDSMSAVGTGLIPALAWAKTKNPDGTSYSVLLKPPEADPVELSEAILAALRDLPAAPSVPAPQVVEKDLLTLYPIADAHIGMMAWGQETGEDYDTKIAASRLSKWVSRAVAAAPASETAIILDVGDLTHADNDTNQTPASKHNLTVDTRHFRTLDATITALVTAIDAARAKHNRVIVRILPGNHNETSYMAVMFALAERYRLDDRVSVDKVPGEYFIHEFGKVMIAAHHGHKAKPDRLVHFFADECAEIWGRTKHRFLFTGHLHHARMQDIGGMTHEQLRAVTARDAYAFSHAYAARSQLQAITFHRVDGEVERAKIGASSRYA